MGCWRAPDVCWRRCPQCGCSPEGPRWRGRSGPWAFGIDLLSAAFLLVVLVPGLASALYGARTPSAARMRLRARGRRAGAGRHGASGDSVPHRVGSDGGARLLPGDVRARARRGAAGGARVPRGDPYRHARAVRAVRLLGRAYGVARLRCAGRPCRHAARRWGGWCCVSRCSGSGSRPASCRCTSGCRMRTRRRPRTSRR